MCVEINCKADQNVGKNMNNTSQYDEYQDTNEEYGTGRCSKNLSKKWQIIWLDGVFFSMFPSRT